jgi:PAS domain S-box-containing protein
MTPTEQPPPDSPAPRPELPDPSFQLALLAAIVESSDDAIVSKTLEGRILSWNRGAARIFGYEAAEVIGKPITIIIPPELHAEERQILEKIGRGERIDHFDTTRVAKDGRRIAISLTVSPIRDPAGVIIGASKIARDISDRKRAEEALREADQRKDQFLALLAHELRNPLAAIRYALAAASKRVGTVKLHKRTEEVIERQVTHMTRLLEDLLDIARITRGALEIKKSSTELTYIIGTAIETARPMLKAKGHTLSLDLPKQSVPLEGDPIRLAQVFSNILINAAKFTNNGGQIALRAVREPEWLVVSVRDNGIGISAELMPRIFDLYSQGHAAFARDESGLGIGLSLVHGLVALHGGTIEARSDGPGKGSEFIIRLPLGHAQAIVEAELGKAPAPETGLNVLVVDDNRDAAETCAALLQASGHRVRTAYTGTQALELAHAFCPHALLANIGLPDINGFEVAQRVRASSWGSDIVLIAVTGWGKEDDRQRAFASGFDYHVTKPASAESIESILHSVSLMLHARKATVRPKRSSARDKPPPGGDLRA